MEVDIEVQLSKMPRAAALEMRKKCLVEFASGNGTTDPDDIVVRPAAQAQALESGISSLLRELELHSDIIRQSGGVLRVGVFYDLEETVVFPFRLSADVVKAIGSLNLAVDATGYPCREDAG